MTVDDFQVSIDQNEAAQQRRAQWDALMKERDEYDRRGMRGRVALVDGELGRLAAEESAGAEAIDVAEARRRAEAKANREALVAALVREREGYLDRGLPDRAALVDAELARFTAEAEPPRKRVETRKTAAARLLGREKT